MENINCQGLKTETQTPTKLPLLGRVTFERERILKKRGEKRLEEEGRLMEERGWEKRDLGFGVLMDV